ncbi:hypothetical protein EPN16_07485 [bacterium]|nr:MAG: hypothetical protein EPN16_07485 [bacterium]
MEFGIKICGVWLGIFARMMMPFLRKSYKGKPAKFNLKYLRITFTSLILSTIFTILIFPKLEISPDEILNLESGFKLFSLAFGFGFGFNSLIIEFSQWFKKNELQKTQASK